MSPSNEGVAMALVRGILLLLAGWLGLCVLMIAMFEALAVLVGGPSEDQPPERSATAAPGAADRSIFDRR
jgi:hypothetical protein